MSKPVSISESFLLQLVQDGLDTLDGLLSGLPKHLLSPRLHRVQHQQLFGQQLLQTSIALVCLSAHKLVHVFLQQQHSGQNVLDPGQAGSWSPGWGRGRRRLGRCRIALRPPAPGVQLWRGADFCSRTGPGGQAGPGLAPHGWTTLVLLVLVLLVLVLLVLSHRTRHWDTLDCLNNLTLTSADP